MVPSDPTEPAVTADGTDRDAMAAADASPPRLPFTVVGIGASAGGLEAFTEFFDAMPPDRGLAFVLVQHLSPKHESMVAELLQRHTEMPVQQVEDGMAVEPDHVYVIRPGYTMTIKDGRLVLGESLLKPGHSRPVDDFFRSLAEEQRERAVCIILSGMGSNGTAGAQAVKVVGGLGLAQEPNSAKFPSMPRSMIDANMADFVLKPGEMPEVLLRYAGHAYARDQQPADLVARTESHQVNDILAILRARVRNDFSGYKRPTIVRRIQRRMSLTQNSGMADYARVLRQTPAEVQNLSDDLMIHVTGFFRDPEVWEALRERVILPMVAEKPDQASIRVWVTACASGEEAYTLAMLLVEAAEQVDKQFDIKVFATDMADRALNHARAGIFPGGIESEIQPSRLTRFFDRDESMYRVKKHLRELVVFAPQNVLQDPPFSRLDIVTCRNLLIYLEPQVQQRVLLLLHFGLREGGALVLGNSETIGKQEDELFEPIDKKLRLYRRIGPTRHGMINFPGRRVGPAAGASSAETEKPLSRASLSQATSKTLLDHHSPPSVVVDRHGRIVYFHGETRRFLGQPSGEPTRDVLELAMDFIRGPVRVALHKAVESGKPEFSKDGVLHLDGVPHRVEIHAMPIEQRSLQGYYLISFVHYPISQMIVKSDGDDGEAEGTLREQMRTLRDELQSTIEELQTSNEEMKASHEELTSVNEELQSTNEELETSKEELQSLNEELTTVNTQLEVKMVELATVGNDLVSLLSSSDTAVIFLDPQFRIRRFTPATRPLIELIPADIGRPLSDFAWRFNDPGLMDAVRSVLSTLLPATATITSDAGRWYERRVLPYRTADDRIDGVVINFIDVTDLKRAAQALRDSEARLEADLAGMRRLYDLHARLASETDLAAALGAILAAAVEFTGTDRGCVQLVSADGRRLDLVAEVGYGPDHPVLASFRGDGHTPANDAVRRTRERVVCEDIEALPTDLGHDALLAAGVRATQSTPMISRAGELIGVLGTQFDRPHRPGDDALRLIDLLAWTAADFVDRHRAELALRVTEDRFRRMADAAPVLIWQTNDAGLAFMNHQFRAFFGRPDEALRGMGWAEFVHPDDHACVTAYGNIVAEHGSLDAQCRFLNRDGEYRWLHSVGRPHFGPDGTFLGLIGCSFDVTDTKNAETSLQENAGRYASLAAHLPHGAAFVVDTDLRYTLAEGDALHEAGLTPADFVGKTIAEAVPPDRVADIEGYYRQALAGESFRHEHEEYGRTFITHGVPLRDAAGRVYAAMAVSYDITDRKLAEQGRVKLLEAEQYARSEAEAANAAKDQFLANVSHELRTPLSAILIWAKLLQDELDPAGMAEGLKVIERSAASQQKLIEDLIDTARVATGKLSLELRPVNLAEVVRDAIGMLRPAADAKGVDIQSDIGKSVGVVMADPDRLQQVVWNLVNNAVKFTPRGGRVDVGVWRMDGTVEIRVSDTGKGIEADVLPHIFGRFRQADPSRTRRHGGLGLGLAISRQLIELHGGTIEAASAGAGRGSVFTIHLPLPRTRTTAKPPARKKGDGELAGVRIVLVEDDDQTRDVVTLLLRRTGATVDAFAMADPAKAAVLADPPNLLLSDIGLPDKDGYTLIREVRDGEPPGTRLAALAFTAFDRPQDREQALECGFNEHVTKPVDPVRLIQTIRTLLKPKDAGPTS